MIIHTFSAYPQALSAINDCLRLAGPQDVIFCRDDSVYALRKTDDDLFRNHQKAVKLTALSPDLDMRGLTHDSLVGGVERLDHAGFIRLCAQADKVIHWG